MAALRGQVTKEAIRQAAMSAFSTHGYRGATLSDIADVLGISRAAVLHHYRSKAELLAAVVTPFLDAYEELLVAFETLAPLPPPDRTRLVAGFVELCARHALPVGVLFRQPVPAEDAGVLARLAPLRARFVALMAGPAPSPVDYVTVFGMVGAVLCPLTEPTIDAGDAEVRAAILRSALGAAANLVA